MAYLAGRFPTRLKGPVCLDTRPLEGAHRQFAPSLRVSRNVLLIWTRVAGDRHAGRAIPIASITAACGVVPGAIDAIRGGAGGPDRFRARGIRGAERWSAGRAHGRVAGDGLAGGPPWRRSRRRVFKVQLLHHARPVRPLLPGVMVRREASDEDEVSCKSLMVVKRCPFPSVYLRQFRAYRRSGLLNPYLEQTMVSLPFLARNASGI